MVEVGVHVVQVQVVPPPCHHALASSVGGGPGAGGARVGKVHEVRVVEAHAVAVLPHANAVLEVEGDAGLAHAAHRRMVHAQPQEGGPPHHQRGRVHLVHVVERDACLRAHLGELGVLEAVLGPVVLPEGPRSVPRDGPLALHLHLGACVDATRPPPQQRHLLVVLEELGGAGHPVELARVVVVLHEGHDLAVSQLAQLVVPADLVDVRRVHQPHVLRAAQRRHPLAVLRLAVVVHHQVRARHPDHGLEQLAQPRDVLPAVEVLHGDGGHWDVGPVRTVLLPADVLLRGDHAGAGSARPVLQLHWDPRLLDGGGGGLPVEGGDAEAVPPEALTELAPGRALLLVPGRARGGRVYQPRCHKRRPSDHQRMVEGDGVHKLHLAVARGAVRALHAHHGEGGVELHGCRRSHQPLPLEGGGVKLLRKHQHHLRVCELYEAVHGTQHAQEIVRVEGIVALQYGDDCLVRCERLRI
mmetsp:Transcript_6113/g.12432  ORF Transcript_6113/g.12432 Transcript_6113/m.12432 type:complete len:470 (-) Transcript_6113:675-2084(-)